MGRAHSRLRCFSLRLRVRLWAVLVPPHITSTTPVPLPYGCTHMRLKPAHLHEPRSPPPYATVSKCVWRQPMGRAHSRLRCFSLRLRVRLWAVLVPLHITSTSPVPFSYGCTRMKLKPAHLRKPPFTTPVDRLQGCVEAGVGSHSLKARLLLPEVESPVLGRPSTPPRHQYKPHTLSLRLHSHDAQAGTPSRASFHHPRRPSQSSTIPEIAGGSVCDECVNDPNGFRDGGSACKTAINLSLIHI